MAIYVGPITTNTNKSLNIEGPPMATSKNDALGENSFFAKKKRTTIAEVVNLLLSMGTLQSNLRRNKP